MTPEGRNVALIRQEIRKLHGIVRKCHWEGVRGAPDLFVMMPWGAHFWIEVKAESGRLAAHQDREIRRMLQAGCSVDVLRNRKEIEAFIDELTESMPYEWPDFPGGAR